MNGCVHYFLFCVTVPLQYMARDHPLIGNRTAIPGRASLDRTNLADKDKR